MDGKTEPISKELLGPTSATATDWYLKAKDIWYYVGLTKNYGNTVSMKKISLIHKLIFKIQQILRSNELNLTIPNPKIIEITFCFPKCAPASKKSVRSIYSFLRYSQF